LAVLLTFLSATPYLNVAAIPNAGQENSSWAAAGPLYPLYIAFMVSCMLIMQGTLLHYLRTATGVVKKRILYILTASVVGVVGLSSYFVSFSFIDLSWLYFPVQILVGFIFAYAIFRHDLLAVSIALRRTALMVGLYAFIGTLLGLIIVRFHHSMQAGGRVEMGTLMALVLLVVSISSVGPWIYSLLVRRLTIFHERTASEITHEFKTPLSAIQSAKTIVEEELEKPTPDIVRVRDYLSMIQRNSERLDGFVHQILALSKADATNGSELRATVDLHALAREVLALFPNDAHRINLKGESVAIVAVEEGLRHILTNLVGNAVACATTGTITLHITEENGQAMIAVQDEGIGIAAEELEQLFKPFQRGKSAPGKGTGLGLVIAKRWVEAHRGRIWAESDGPGRGARFCFVIPK